MTKGSPPNQEPFIPHSFNEVFAIYLSRELRDTASVRFYVRLTELHSMVLLLNALRAARRRKGHEEVSSQEFLKALEALVREDWPV